MSSENSISKHYDLNERYNRVGDKNVWVEFTALARDYNAVNLGQVLLFSYQQTKKRVFTLNELLKKGFPDYPSYKHMNEKVLQTVNDSTSLIHQYTRSPVRRIFIFCKLFDFH